MLNYVWLFLITIGVLVAAITGNIKEITASAFSSAGAAVNISLGLVGIMALWLGFMKIAEEAGLVKNLARLIRPISKRLFPEIPQDHPAIGAMMMNISANWLGLANAATPFGIKAMEQLQSLNGKKDTASNSMILFLALNTASITLIPMTIIGVRASLGSKNPTEIIGTTIFASLIATLVAIVTVKMFIAFEAGKEQLLASLKRSWKSWIVFFIFLSIIITGIKFNGFVILQNNLPKGFFRIIIETISNWAIPFLLIFFPIIAFIKKVKVYEAFVDGAKEGFQVAIRIIPFLVAILVAIGIFRASGAMDFFITILSPITEKIGMPADVLPAALMRPLSGSGTLGIITELLETHGPESFAGRLASTIYGCTETTFYVIAVYFGAVQVKKTRFAIPAGLIADAAGVLAAVFICRLMFL